jgi:hypothetical protein
MTRTIKPSASDQQFHQALQKVMQLDQQLQPAISGLYRHLCDALETGHDRELFQLFVILQTGSNLSLYAPRHMLSMEMVLGDYLEIYTTWARKAEELLGTSQAIKTTTKPGTRRKHARKATPGAQERQK